MTHAGPSGAGSGAVTPDMLTAAEDQFQAGIQAIKDNNLDRAVELFASVLEIRTKHYGDLAPECASAYYRYGAALLYQAQDSADVFAGAMGGTSEEPEGDKENDDSKSPAVLPADDLGKGKAPAAEAPASDEEEGGELEEGHAAPAEQAESDLQLAWENLETAKVIWQRAGDEAYARELADVHMLLSDVAMESDDFATALEEADAGLKYLERTVAVDDRRLAEAHYKRCMALQFGSRPDDALAAVRSAVAVLKARKAALEAPAEGQNEDEEARLAEELADVGAVLEDLADKEAELQELVGADDETRAMLRGVLGQLAPAAAAAAAGGPPTERGQPKAVAAVASEQAGFDGAGTGAAPAAAVQNLGVVGRGTKRIKLQPVAAAPAAAAATAGEAPAAAGAAGGEPKKKRSLEDLVGGSGGETMVGFGSAPAPPAAEAKNPALPAFLQPAKVSEAYASPAAPAAGGNQPGNK